MAMVVKNNMSAVRTLNTLNQNSSALSKSLSRVSSGMKINSAQDDAAGYAISERMRVRIRSLDQANQNTQNDSSLMKTAEGAVSNTVELLRALKEKAINAANDSNTDEDRQTIQKELNQFIDQIDDNALVQFNGKYLVDGSKNNASVASKTILLNQSLKLGTQAADELVTYANRAGDSLGIQKTDKWQVSWVQNGEIHTYSGEVGTNSLTDILTASELTGKGVAGVTSNEGLIGEGDADLTPGYKKVGDKPENVVATDNKTLTQIKNMFASAADSDGNPVDWSPIDGAAGSVSINYYTTKSDGTIDTDNPIAITVTSTEKTPATTPATYDLTVTGVPDLTNTDIYSKLNTTDKAIEAGTLATVDLAGAKGLVTALGGNGSTFDTALPSTGTVNSSTTKKFSELGVTTNSALKFYKEATAETEVNLDTSTVTVNYNSTGGIGSVVVQINGSAASAGDKVYKTNPNYKDPNNEVEPTVTDKFNKEVYTPDKTQGIAFVASKAGVNDQISGLTISILDQDGNVKKAANAALDQFKQYQRAENQTGDMSLNFHIGSEANVAIKVGLGDMRSEALGLKGSDGQRILVTTKENANASINVIENALTKALDQQTTIGAVEARLEYTATNLTTSSENVQAAESTIRDADMAKEMTNYTKNNVLLQAAQAMLAQANQNSSAVLSLLQ